MRRVKYVIYFSIITVLALCGLSVNRSTSALAPGVNQIMSVDASGVSANEHSQSPSISGNGRYVVFTSTADNLVPNDTNNAWDIFLKDRTSGSIIRVSVSSTGVQANSDSDSARISYDGHYVVYESNASNLVSGDMNGTENVFMYNTQTASTTLVDTSATGTYGDAAGGHPDISADGRFVVFDSYASNLISSINPTGVGYQVFLKDITTGAIQALSVDSSGTQGNNDSMAPRISCDGNIVTFLSSASNLVTGDTNASADIFIVSIGWSGNAMTDITLGANGRSTNPAVSCNGNVVVYNSVASDITGGVSNNTDNVFKYSRLDESTSLVSVNSTGYEANDLSVYPSVSDDGRLVAFQTNGTNMYNGYSAAGAWGNVVVRDTKLNTTELLSITTSGYASGGCQGAEISADGASVAYQSGSDHSDTNSTRGLVMTDSNGYSDIFVSETGY